MKPTDFARHAWSTSEMRTCQSYQSTSRVTLRIFSDCKLLGASSNSDTPPQNSDDLALQVTADLSRTVQALEQALENQAEREERPQESATQQITQAVGEALDKGVADRKVVSVVRRAMSNLLLTEGLRRPAVFLSHSRLDSKLATALGRALRAEGVDPWLDIEQIQPFDSIADRLEAGLDSADAIAVFVSGSLGSWQNAELGFILQRRLSSSRGPLAFAVLTGDAEIPALLRDTMYFDLRDGDAERVAKGIVASIRSNLD